MHDNVTKIISCHCFKWKSSRSLTKMFGKNKVYIYTHVLYSKLIKSEIILILIEIRG